MSPGVHRVEEPQRSRCTTCGRMRWIVVNVWAFGALMGRKCGRCSRLMPGATP